MNIKFKMKIYKCKSVSNFRQYQELRILVLNLHYFFVPLFQIQMEYYDKCNPRITYFK